MQAISPQYQDLTCFTCSQPCRVFDGLDLSFLPPLLCSVAVDLWPPTNNMREQFVRSGYPSAFTAEAENSFDPGIDRWLVTEHPTSNQDRIGTRILQEAEAMCPLLGATVSETPSSLRDATGGLLAPFYTNSIAFPSWK